MRSRLSALRSVATSVAKVLLPPKRPLGGAKPLPTPSKPAKPGRPAPATPDIEFAGITISYTPSRDGDADPGEVVWTWVPYEDDPSQGKDRPVVVVGTRGRRLVVVPLTSKRHDDEPQASLSFSYRQ